MIKNSIISKILLYFLSMIIAVFALLAFFASFLYKEFLIKTKVNNLNIQIEMLSSYVFDYMSELNSDNIKYLSKYVKIMSDLLDVDVVLSDSLNYVYLVSNDLHKNLLGKQLNNTYYINELVSVYDEELQVYVYKLTNNLYESNVYKGNVTVMFSKSSIFEKVTKFSVVVFIVFILSVLFIIAFIWILLKKILIKPIENINSIAKRFALGDVQKRVYVNSNDEIGELSNSFNYMAESLEKIDANRREFLSNVSHELRTPLTTIIGFLSGILDGIIPPENHVEKIEVVYGEVKRLSRLVNDLLDLTAMESGKFILRFKIIELNSLIKYTVNNFEQEIKQNSIVMEVLLENNSISVIADEDRLLQVLNNLIANAIKYCDDKRYINISAQIKNGKVFVTIFNTAKLLSEDEFNNIWVRFYKNDKSRTAKESTGLGLSIVRNIISQFGEEIWVENKIKEEGVSFTFTLQLNDYK